MIRAAISTVPGAAARDLPYEEARAWPTNADKNSESLLWIDCGAPAPDELEALEKTIGLHPLTVEDLTHRNQRAKLEENPCYLFLVLHWFATADSTAHPHELHVIVGHNWLATVYDDRRIA